MAKTKTAKALAPPEREHEEGQMKAYVCNRHKSLMIRNVIQFENGLFETDYPDLQALVESNDLWEIHIWPRDLPPEVAELHEVEDQGAQGGGAFLGMRGSQSTEE